MLLKRTLELLAMLIIGDSVLTALDMHRHISLWDARWWHPMMQWFHEHAGLTRLAAVAGIGAGVLLASQQRRMPVPKTRLARAQAALTHV